MANEQMAGRPTDAPDNFREALRRRAAERGAQPALIDPLGTVGYAELFAQVERFGDALAAAGFGARHRIALASPFPQSTARLQIAIGCNATLVPIDPALSRDAVANLFSRVKIDALIAEGSEADPARAAARGLGVPVMEAADGALVAPARAGHGPRPARALPGPDDIMYIMPTSGTTGAPKLIPRTHGTLMALLLDPVSSFGLQAGDAWIIPQPMHHAAGLLGLIRLLERSAIGVCLGGFELREFARWARATNAVGYNGTPLIHGELLRAAQADPELLGDWRPRHIRSASAALPRAIVEGLEQRFGATIMVHYGMTEASGLAMTTVTADTYVPGLVGRRGHTEVRIIDPEGRTLGVGEVGEIVARGPGVFKGYIDDPELDAQSFIDGWFRTRDLGSYDADGNLHLGGRTAEVINRGGAKVSAREVEQWLNEQPGIALSVVFPVRHAAMGEDVMAAVVPVKGETIDPKQLRIAMLASMPGYKVPSRIVPVADLPLGPAGKVLRAGLAEALKDRLAPAWRAPASASERLVVALMQQMLELPRIGVDDDFFALGGHSLLAVRMLSRLQADTGRRIAPARFMRDPSAAGLAALLDQRDEPDFDPAIEPYRPTGTAAPLFFAPGVDGHPHVARKFLPFLPPDVPVFGIHRPPTLDLRSDLIESIAHHAADRIREVQPQGPYRIAGYSFGGGVAGAIAARLEALGERVDLLVVIDTDLSLDRLAEAPVTEDQALASATRRHRWRPFDAPLVLLRSWRQPLRQATRPGLGWECLARHGVEVFDLQTTHYGMAFVPHAARVGEIIADCLARPHEPDPAGGADSPARAATGSARGPAPDHVLPFAPLPEALSQARAQWIAGQADAAKALLRDLDGDPRLPAWAQMLVERLMGGTVPARGMKLPALGVRPETRVLVDALGLRRQGDMAGANAKLAELEALHDGAPERLVTACGDLVDAGWATAAKPWLQRALASGSTAARLDACLLLCNRAFDRAEWPAVVRYGRTMIEIEPDGSAAYPLVIAGLAQSGRADEARALLEQALQRTPGRFGYRALLEECLQTRHPNPQSHAARRVRMANVRKAKQARQANASKASVGTPADGTTSRGKTSNDRT